MWNDTEIPLAYLVTFRCFGTWLHGDERGSIDRFNNIYKTPYLPPNDKRLQRNVERLKIKPVELDAARRDAVEFAIRETCEKRKWLIHALNVRTNHAHVVASIGTRSPGIALNAFKANATRIMRERKLWKYEQTPWAARGSKRRLWNERSIEIAIDYVLNGQGNDLPDFD